MVAHITACKSKLQVETCSKMTHQKKEGAQTLVLWNVMRHTQLWLRLSSSQSQYNNKGSTRLLENSQATVVQLLSPTATAPNQSHFKPERPINKVP